MKIKRKSGKPARLIWLTGLAIALMVHAIGLLVFQLGDDEPDSPDIDFSFASLPSIRWQEAEGDLLREQAYLFDSAPLFLPTRWNSASSPDVKALEKRPGDLFDSYPARLSYGEGDFGLGTIITVEAESPVRSLRAFNNRIHTYFGREEVPQPNLQTRFAKFEVVDQARGEVILRAPVSGEGAPVVRNRLWRPAEFLLQVEAVGVVGQPVLLRGSGVDEVDQFLRDSLRRLARQQMLDSGYYRVFVGP